MEFIKKLSKREKILLSILVFLIIELLIYSLFFSPKIKAIEDYQFSFENLKIEEENKKILDMKNNKEAEISMPIKEVKDDYEGFIKDFPNSRVETNENSRKVSVQINRDNLNNIKKVSEHYSYDNAYIVQDENGYNASFQLANVKSIVPTILKSNENIKDKYLKYSKNETKTVQQDKKLEAATKSQLLKVNKDTNQNTNKKDISNLSKVEESKIINDKNVENFIEINNSKDNAIISEENNLETIKNNIKIFPFSFENSSSFAINGGNALLIPINNGFNIFYNTKTIEQINIYNQIDQQIKNLKLKVFAPEKTSAILHIGDESFALAEKENLIELENCNISNMVIILNHSEENLLTFQFEGEI